MARTEAVAPPAEPWALNIGPVALGRPGLFYGENSLRVPRERTSLWMSLLAAPLTIGLLGLLFKSITLADMILLIVAGMVYVSLARGRLLGSSIRIHSRQLPELHEIVESLAAQIGIAPPQIFVRDDPFVPIAAVGVGEPYALMLSSQYLEHLRPAELRFLIARELGHIAAGHTRLTSLLSVSGKENPAVALVFGSWLRSAEYTADRAGLLCAESLDVAIAAISITTFHAIGRRIDAGVLVEQHRELARDATLRMGEWTSGMPYAVNRISRLATFASSELAQFWRKELMQPLPPVVVAQDGPSTHVDRRDCAPVWRRALTFGIDFLVVGTILKTVETNTVGEGVVSKAATHSNNNGLWFQLAHFLSQHGLSLSYSSATVETVFGLFLYSVILVALSGRTLGMMVAELRVVTTQFEQAGIARTIWRYAVATFDLLALPIALIGLIFRVQPHDRLSGTRVVRSRSLPA